MPKGMTFNQANGKYRSIRYDLTILSDGTEEARCDVYMDPCILRSGKTWREALDRLRDAINPPEPDETEAPE